METLMVLLITILYIFLLVQGRKIELLEERIDSLRKDREILFNRIEDLCRTDSSIMDYVKDIEHTIWEEGAENEI